MNNKLEIFKKKLIYRAGYRGTKEMDILLSSFVNKYINDFDENLLVELEKFLNLEDQEYVVKNIPKYNLTKGINEKKYRNISEQVINNLPKIDDWLNENFIKENKLTNWNESIIKLHTSKDGKNNQSKSFRRIVFDELCANFLTLSKNRKRIRIKKISKNIY